MDEEPLVRGHRVTYLPGKRKSGPQRLCRRGIVTGPPVLDTDTEVTWVPVQADGTHDADEWVRADAIIDVVAPT
ncbi:hypothetical protein ABZU76_21135 [Amycolatopsis sp. NPDC005232]|uniref:hypothetical protein n=1 Tax=Amycolatopsis sp. NPDC005232 TaxID=3157027 RepID=UPI0033A89BD4